MNLQCTLKFLKHSLPALLLKFMVLSRFIMYYRVFIRRLYANGYVSFRPAASFTSKFLKIFSFEVRIWCCYKTTTSNLANLSKLKAFWGIFLYVSEDAGRIFCFRPGFCSLLHRPYCARSLPTNVCREGTSAMKLV